MAALALTVVGGAVGFAVGGPAGVKWGMLAGSLAGSVLFAPTTNSQGPRLGDLRVQSSALGVPIPIVYGASRLAGNMIWSAPILETATTTESGGKGGGGAKQTSYSYSQSFAVAICEGEIHGVRRMWANGELIYNNSDTADDSTLAASEAALSFRFYGGSETQTADSLIEAAVGAADCPAYRGIAYVVFENLQLADYGNRTPNIEFEVLSSAYTNVHVGDSEFVATEALPRGICYEPVTNSVWVTNTATSNVSRINVSTGVSTEFTVEDVPFAICFEPSTSTVWVANQNSDSVSRINVVTGTVYTFSVGPQPYAICVSPYHVWIATSGDSSLRRLEIAGLTYIDIPLAGDPKAICFDPVTSSIWVAYQAEAVISKISVTTGASIELPCENPSGDIIYDSITASVWLTNSGDSSVNYAISGDPDILGFDPIGKALWISDVADTQITRFSLTDESLNVFIISEELGAMTYDAGNNKLWATKTSLNGVYKISAVERGWTANTVTLEHAVVDICQRAGLVGYDPDDWDELIDVDATALTDTISGYIVTRSSARSQIAQLAQAYFFDAVESAGLIKFVPRGGESVFDITEDDLAAHPYGSESPPSLTLTRQQEMELPVELSVQYMEAEAAYAVGTQSSQRLTTSSQNKQSVELALAMSATKAKQIADVLMYDAWTARTAFDSTTSWKYAHIEPTDVGTLTKGGRTYTVRITAEDASSGLFARQAVLEDTSVYTQTATAAALPVPADTVDSIPLTALLLLDIPLLRDQDDGNGFYAAACGYTDAWTGAQLFKSSDAGATWASFGNAFLNAASIGVASTVLADFTQDIFDESGSVTVTMRHGELASDTEINVLNGANVALLGSEIIQFRTATLVSTGIYTLTGLLRGRLGTEWARSLHEAGDNFVLLTTATTYATIGASAEYDLERHYRAVTFGHYLDDAATIAFTNTAVAKMPYAPVQLGGGRNAALDLTINWVRRTRLSGGWNNYADVPLGEDSEAYEVEIYSSATYVTLKRTITGISSATTSYTAAQQTTDFGSTQATVYFIVYQVSATVGRGYAARGVV